MEGDGGHDQQKPKQQHKPTPFLCLAVAVGREPGEFSLATPRPRCPEAPAGPWGPLPPDSDSEEVGGGKEWRSRRNMRLGFGCHGRQF